MAPGWRLATSVSRTLSPSWTFRCVVYSWKDRTVSLGWLLNGEMGCKMARSLFCLLSQNGM